MIFEGLNMSLTPNAYYDLRDAFAQSDCAICRLLERATQQYLDALLYEYVNDTTTHDQLRASWGLCRTHNWQLTQFKGRAVGIAILQRVVIEKAIKTLPRVRPSHKRRLAFTDHHHKLEVLSPTAPCIACDAQRVAEENLVNVFVDSLMDERFYEAFTQSDGLCLAHVRFVLSLIRDEGVWASVVEAQKNIWIRLRDELALFQDKNSENKGHEAIGEEGDSWLRTISALVGPPTSV